MPFVFEYAIRFNDGTYYTGRRSVADDDYRGERWQAYTYTEKGAHATIEHMKWDATVERMS